MYGSQFHFEQNLNVKRLSTSLLEKNISIPNKKKSNCVILGLITLSLTISTITFAGSSQPRLAGGNGNSNGR